VSLIYCKSINVCAEYLTAFMVLRTWMVSSICCKSMFPHHLLCKFHEPQTFSGTFWRLVPTTRRQRSVHCPQED